MEEYYKGPCVYFITDGKYVKIGVANDVEKRLKSLQTANANELVLLKTIPTDNPAETEYHMHEIYASKRIRGEWFDILDEFDWKPKDEYLKPKDIEKLLQLSHGTVFKLIQKGEIPCVIIGHSIRILKSDLDTYITEHKR